MALQRKTELKRGGELKRSELKRTTPLKRTPSGRRPPRPRGVYCTRTADGNASKRCARKRYPGSVYCDLHYADDLARSYVKARDGKCMRCPNPEGKRLEWAHLYSRRYKLIRHDPLNALTLCIGCHYWQTNNPLEGEDFFIERIGEAAWLDLRRRARADRKPDYDAVIRGFLTGNPLTGQGAA